MVAAAFEYGHSVAATAVAADRAIKSLRVVSDKTAQAYQNRFRAATKSALEAEQYPTSEKPPRKREFGNLLCYNPRNSWKK